MQHPLRAATFKLVLGIGVSMTAALAAPRMAGAQTEDQQPAAEKPAEKQATELDLLTFHKDNYFITGFTGSVQSKFQFSAKFDLWPNEGHHAFHLAYTQKSLWDTYEHSSPFAESNYNPDVFYTYFHAEDRYKPAPGCGFFSERLGAEHESNGEDDPRSRAWNRVYVESRFACNTASGLYATARLKVWAPPFGKDTENARIVQYLGYGELGLSVGTEGGGKIIADSDLTIVVRKGTSRDLGRAGLEIDGRVRPAYGDFWRFTPYLYAQYFVGFGETLLNFDRPVSAFRVGLGLSDKKARTN